MERRIDHATSCPNLRDQTTVSQLPMSQIPKSSSHTPTSIQSVIDRLVWTYGRQPLPLRFRQSKMKSVVGQGSIIFDDSNMFCPTPALPSDALEYLSAPLVSSTLTYSD